MKDERGAIQEPARTQSVLQSTVQETEDRGQAGKSEGGRGGRVILSSTKMRNWCK